LINGRHSKRLWTCSHRQSSTLLGPQQRLFSQHCSRASYQRSTADPIVKVNATSHSKGELLAALVWVMWTLIMTTTLQHHRKEPSVLPTRNKATVSTKNAAAETFSTRQNASAQENQPARPSTSKLRALHSKNHFGAKRQALKDLKRPNRSLQKPRHTAKEQMLTHNQAEQRISKLITPGEIRLGMSSYSTSKVKAGLGDSHFATDTNQFAPLRQSISRFGLENHLMSHRQLEMTFLRISHAFGNADFTVLEKRQNTATINAIHRHHIRDMKVFGHTYIR
ncbi:hypothetical protein BJ741DRAFT_693426, partial [Chytriomyces cf. hyalinus JEL632]